MDLFSFFSDYLQSQVDEINHSIYDLTNPGYTYLFLAILIKISRKLNKMK